MMRDEKLIRLRPHLLDAPIWHGILMAGMMPAIAMTSVDLLVHEPDAASPVEEIAKARCLSDLPKTLDLFSPTRFHDLVKV